MKPLAIWVVATSAAVLVPIGALVSSILVFSGSHPLIITPWISVLFTLIGVLLLWAGRGVKRLKRRESTWVTPIMAARIAIFSRSSAPVIAGFGGFLLGVALVGFTRLWAPIAAASAWTALAGFLAATFGAVSAVVVERWCIDDTDEDEDGNRGNLRGEKGAGSPSPSPRSPRVTPPASHPVDQIRQG